MEQLTMWDLSFSRDACRGHRIAITGTLPITRNEMISLIETHGGTYDASVTRTTDILILGTLRPTAAIPDGISRKLRRARQIQTAGGEIMILTLDEFQRMMEE